MLDFDPTFDPVDTGNSVVLMLPRSNVTADFRGVKNPPDPELIRVIESLYDIAHANEGAKELLLPVLRKGGECWVSLGISLEGMQELQRQLAELMEASGMEA